MDNKEISGSNKSGESNFSNQQVKALNTEKEIISLLIKQNVLLEAIRNDLIDSRNDYLESSFHSRIEDFNMSIGSMIGLSFKWLIASIPIGIFIAFIYFVIIYLFAGNLF